MAAMVLTGTLYPLLLEALDAGKISVGPPYFGTLFALLLTPLIVLLPLGFNVRWNSDNFRRLISGLWIPATAAIGFGVATLFLAPEAGLIGIAAVSGGIWVMTATFMYYRTRLRKQKRSWPSRSETGMCLAHFGVGIFLIGAGLTNTISSEKHLRMIAGDRFDLAGYEFVFEGTRGLQGPNYVADEGEFSVYRKGNRVATMYPQKRRYLVGGQVMTEAAIDPGLTRDLYVSLGESLDENGQAWAIRIYHKPFVRFIWLGALLMMAGGFVAASDRRYRRKISDRNTNPADEDSLIPGSPAAEPAR
jgi:cytochrome c-type biogenesis protein CcmF